MKVGMLMVFQNFKDQISDTEAYQRDMPVSYTHLRAHET